MYAKAIAAPSWTTSSFADTTDTSPAELSALGAHVSRCNGCRGRWFTLRCGIDALHDMVAGRIVTTLLIVGAVIGIGAVLL